MKSWKFCTRTGCSLKSTSGSENVTSVHVHKGVDNYYSVDTKKEIRRFDPRINYFYQLSSALFSFGVKRYVRMVFSCFEDVL